MAAGWTARRAELTDAERIGVVHARSWRHAYRGLVPSAVLDALDPVERAGAWRERLTGPEGPGIFVAVRHHPSGAEKIGAFSAAGPVREPHGPDAGCGELYALYADPLVIGTGAGHVAHQAALRVLRDAGCRRAELVVLAGNRVGRDFYERHGWRRDGQPEPHVVRGVPLPALRYHRPVVAQRGQSSL